MFYGCEVGMKYFVHAFVFHLNVAFVVLVESRIVTVGCEVWNGQWESIPLILIFVGISINLFL